MAEQRLRELVARRDAEIATVRKDIRYSDSHKAEAIATIRSNYKAQALAAAADARTSADKNIAAKREAHAAARVELRQHQMREAPLQMLENMRMRDLVRFGELEAIRDVVRAAVEYSDPIAITAIADALPVLMQRVRAEGLNSDISKEHFVWVQAIRQAKEATLPEAFALTRDALAASVQQKTQLERELVAFNGAQNGLIAESLRGRAETTQTADGRYSTQIVGAVGSGRLLG
jgi:hypothetical protein